MTGLRRLWWIGSLLVLAATLVGCAPNGGAYGGRGLAGRPGRMPPGPSVDEIIEELELAEAETPEIRGVLQASEDERSEIMAKHTGQNVKQIEKDLERDNFMGAEDAVKYGLIDTVLADRKAMGSKSDD